MTLTGQSIQLRLRHMEGCTIKRWYKSKVMTQIFETFGYIDLTALVHASPKIRVFFVLYISWKFPN